MPTSVVQRSDLDGDGLWSLRAELLLAHGERDVTSALPGDAAGDHLLQVVIVGAPSGRVLGYSTVCWTRLTPGRASTLAFLAIWARIPLSTDTDIARAGA